jgi:chromosome segregation ATPase
VLANALESANYGDADGRLTYGNELGRELLKDRHNMKEMMKRLEAKVGGLQNEVGGLQNQNANFQHHITGLQNEVGGLQNQNADFQHQITDLRNENAGFQHHINDLEHHVKDLKLASEGYRKIRNRFINVYCRDVLGYVTHQEHQQIRDGNNAAYGGDAVIDASLYTSWERNDEDVFILLYGLSASQISYQGKC